MQHKQERRCGGCKHGVPNTKIKQHQTGKHIKQYKNDWKLAQGGQGKQTSVMECDVDPDIQSAGKNVARVCFKRLYLTHKAPHQTLETCYSECQLFTFFSFFSLAENYRLSRWLKSGWSPCSKNQLYQLKLV